MKTFAPDDELDSSGRLPEDVVSKSEGISRYFFWYSGNLHNLQHWIPELANRLVTCHLLCNVDRSVVLVVTAIAHR